MKEKKRKENGRKIKGKGKGKKKKKGKKISREIFYRLGGGSLFLFSHPPT